MRRRVVRNAIYDGGGAALRPGKTYGLPSLRSCYSSRISTHRGANGTRCARSAFVRSDVVARKLPASCRERPPFLDCLDRQCGVGSCAQPMPRPRRGALLSNPSLQEGGRADEEARAARATCPADLRGEEAAMSIGANSLLVERPKCPIPADDIHLNLCENLCEKIRPKSTKIEEIGKNLLNGTYLISTTCWF